MMYICIHRIDPIDLDELEEVLEPFENVGTELVQHSRIGSVPKMSWLLQISLENLGITISSLKVNVY